MEIKLDINGMDEETINEEEEVQIFDLHKTAHKLRTAVATQNVRKLFAEKPITMHKIYPGPKPMLWPQVIKNAYAEIWSGNHNRIIIKAPRGGGKSQLLGTIGFDMWFLKKRTVVAMGGSLTQAEIVYSFFSDHCSTIPGVKTTVRGKVKRGGTAAVDGHTFSCLAASPKQVRGKHPDILISDETCETSDELIDGALPSVNDSDNPLVIMASTFHKAFGRFAEVWDNADERGYFRIQWDIFDVATPFGSSFWDQPEIKIIPGIQKLKAFAKGRTGDPEGWIPISNIIQAWREKPSENWFEVEYLGTRPSSSGLVLKPEDVDTAMFDGATEHRYDSVQASARVIGIKWGFSSMTSLVELASWQDDMAIITDSKNYHNAPAHRIIGDIVEKVRAHAIRFIFTAIGAPFENESLRAALAEENLPCSVMEVDFNADDKTVGNLRAHFEQHKIKLPKKFREAYLQFKNYRYREDTDIPMEEGAQIPIATMCALEVFKLSQFPRQVPPPKLPEKPHRRDSHETSFSNLGEDDMPNDKPINAGWRDKIF